jgi:hypothetical protein
MILLKLQSIVSVILSKPLEKNLSRWLILRLGRIPINKNWVIFGFIIQLLKGKKWEL